MKPINTGAEYACVRTFRYLVGLKVRFRFYEFLVASKVRLAIVEFIKDSSSVNGICDHDIRPQYKRSGGYLLHAHKA
uniref:Uncharacterized protein n=1 Tax=Glossina palpalis gambiensis TaxID=67801 RepID=A0A1B0APK6_9MUSC